MEQSPMRLDRVISLRWLVEPLEVRERHVRFGQLTVIQILGRLRKPIGPVAGQTDLLEEDEAVCALLQGGILFRLPLHSLARIFGPVPVGMRDGEDPVANPQQCGAAIVGVDILRGGHGFTCRRAQRRDGRTQVGQCVAIAPLGQALVADVVAEHNGQVCGPQRIVELRLAGRAPQPQDDAFISEFLRDGQERPAHDTRGPISDQPVEARLLQSRQFRVDGLLAGLGGACAARRGIRHPADAADLLGPGLVHGLAAVGGHHVCRLGRNRPRRGGGQQGQAQSKG